MLYGYLSLVFSIATLPKGIIILIKIKKVWDKRKEYSNMIWYHFLSVFFAGFRYQFYDLKKYNIEINFDFSRLQLVVETFGHSTK